LTEKRVRKTTGLRNTMLFYGRGVTQFIGIIQIHSLIKLITFTFFKLLMDNQIETVSFKRYMREKNARLQAERLLEEKSLQLHDKSMSYQQIADDYKKLAVSLEEQVQERTQSLKVAVAEAHRANQVKSEFLANISHEIRTPMSIVIGMTDLALKKDLSDKQRNYIEKAHISGKSLYKLVEKMLDFSEIESGKIQDEISPIDINLLALKLNESNQSLAEKKGISFTVDLEENVPQYVLGDEKHLMLALNELIDNAFKFTEKDGQVSVLIKSVKIDNDYTQLIVQIIDTGIGISEEQNSNLFKLFTQLDGSNTRHYGGVGLGLTYAKSLIEMMHGTISFDSQLRKGTTFTISLNLKIMK